MMANTDQMAEPLLIRQGEACKRLGVSAATLKAEITAGRLRYVLVGKRRKFKPGDLDAYIERQGRGCDGNNEAWSPSGAMGSPAWYENFTVKGHRFRGSLETDDRRPPRSSPLSWRRTGATGGRSEPSNSSPQPRITTAAARRDDRQWLGAPAAPIARRTMTALSAVTNQAIASAPKPWPTSSSRP
jgi:excisionase family DNA binding protein